MSLLLWSVLLHPASCWSALRGSSKEDNVRTSRLHTSNRAMHCAWELSYKVGNWITTKRADRMQACSAQCWGWQSSKDIQPCCASTAVRAASGTNAFQRSSADCRRTGDSYSSSAGEPVPVYLVSAWKRHRASTLSQTWGCTLCVM